MSKSLKVLQEAARRRPHDLFGKTYEGEEVIACPGIQTNVNMNDQWANEILCAITTEANAAAEQTYYRRIKDKLGDTGPLWTQDDALDPNESFTALTTMILEQAKTVPNANMAIISPTVLTILQAAHPAPLFIRKLNSDENYWSRIVGYLDDLHLMIDAYANDDAPVLIGHIPGDPAQRKVSYAFNTLYLKEGYDEGWTQVRIDAQRLTFA